MSRALTLFLVILGLATPAAAAAGVRWSTLASGTTTPSGKQNAAGYVAVTRAGERAFTARLDASARRGLARVALQRTSVVAVFLDGAPCATKVAVTHLARAGSTLTVRVAYTPPPAGVAMCVRTSTAFLLLAVPRSSLGRPAPAHVVVDAAARA